MNYLDTYDITGTGAITPQPNSQPEQSLNDEVSQVIGQLGRFWGGFRKQSQSALEAARKDLGDVVSQAQKELSKLTAADASASEPETTTPTGAETEGDQPEAGSSTDGDKTPSPRQRDLPSSPTQSLFSRLQSSLPPNIVATVQTHLPESIKNASSVDFAQLKTNLSAEFQRVQGVTLAQAEEYVHKSEGLLREAMREAGEVLKDAVKVIPPEEGGSTPGVMWDGTDVWMLPTPSSSNATSKGKEPETEQSSGKPSSEAQRSAATRAQSLLKQLKYDPAVIKADPGAEESLKEQYATWIHDELDSKDGGLANQYWVDLTKGALDDSSDGRALQETHDLLVPSDITDETFWKRYHFRVHQVEKQEEIRKALLEGSVENEDEFSWEDDEEEAAATSPQTKTTPISVNDSASSQRTVRTAKPKLAAVESVSSSAVATPANTSPRQSEDSFDLVSSGNVSAVGEQKAVPPKKVEESEESEEEESDEEESDDDEDEEDDEKEGKKEVVKPALAKPTVARPTAVKPPVAKPAVAKPVAEEEDDDDDDEEEDEESGESDWE
ncbi:hypothetical protein HWV62_22996 [Athelia sp. TMB]|nr:hypothetical protein HWV62_24434 [Athelia sp. TMB]KAF7983313.1 hypothetical protein HWV62_22996 [Athelia sp. TMB]